MSRDISTYQNYLRWFAHQQRVADAWARELRARRYTAIRRTGPTTRWATGQRTRPGDAQ